MKPVNAVYLEACKAYEAGRLGECETLCDQILASLPDEPNTLHLLGLINVQARRYGIGIQHLRRSAHLAPKDDSVWNNLGNAYRTVGDKQKAIEAFIKSNDLSPKAGTLSNICGCYINNGTPEKALYWAEKALHLEPGHTYATYHRGLARLELGDYENGFKDYEARLKIPNRKEFGARNFGSIPRWDGKPVNCLVVHGEQGLGDEILFMTWIKKLRPLVDRLVIECAERLVPLIQSAFGHDKNIMVYGSHDEVMKKEIADAYIPMGSLPMMLGPVERNAYLFFHAMFSATPKRIGISWYGGTRETHTHLRNAPISSWQPLVDQLKAVGAEVISLQYGEDAKDEARFLDIPHDQEAIDDLSELARLVKSCDLVISVCNTTIHMAGALGTTCWVLTPACPAWRYGLKGERMPWYQSVKLYRQKADAQEKFLDFKGWLPVLDRIGKDAVDFIQRKEVIAA